MALRSILLVALSTVFIAACAPPPKVAVEERSVLTARQESEKLGGQLIRIVQPGDTLYSIAFVNNLDVNRIAAWNGINDTSRLEVGQRIRLTEPLGFVYPKPAVVANNPGSKTTRNPASSHKTNSRVAAPTAPSDRADSVISGLSQPWSWPTRGKVISTFSVVQGRQGIDIQAQQGQAVIAASGGEVVYVGNSLKGYGNLIIIKHSDQYLSAYAHNKSIFVSEGEIVTAQRKIGSVGVNNQRKNALHFQIRRNGKPVNPLQYLPKI